MSKGNSQKKKSNVQGKGQTRNIFLPLVLHVSGLTLAEESHPYDPNVIHKPLLIFFLKKTPALVSIISYWRWKEIKEPVKTQKKKMTTTMTTTTERLLYYIGFDKILAKGNAA